MFPGVLETRGQVVLEIVRLVGSQNGRTEGVEGEEIQRIRPDAGFLGLEAAECVIEVDQIARLAVRFCIKLARTREIELPGRRSRIREWLYSKDGVL